MNQLDRFIRHLCIELQGKYETLHKLWVVCKNNDLICSECTSPVKKGETTCDKHKPKCTIVIQSGSRKGQECNKTCKSKNRCKLHEGINMCTNKDCSRISEKDKELCLFHKKEARLIEDMEKPYFSIRSRENSYLIKHTYYIINKTNVVIDPMYNTAIGYVDEFGRIIYESNKDVERECKKYKIRYQNSVNL